MITRTIFNPPVFNPSGVPHPPRQSIIVQLELHEVKAIIKTLLDLSYNKSTDIFEVESEIIKMAEELGIH